MGQTLSEPITEKHSTHGDGKKYIFGASEMQGWRITMEDAHTTLVRLQDKDAAFFAVFDGHGGQTAAKFCGEHMHGIITAQPEYERGQIEAAIRKGFMQADIKIKDDPEFKKDPAGCTAVCALITANNEMFCGNAGDSRCILSANGTAVAMSEDHKPTLKEETARIVAAGGFVEFGRVDGSLALSRAIGDFEFKKSDQLPPEEQKVTANPEIKSRQLQETDEFIVVACDGIWDVLSSQMVIDFVRQRIAEHVPLDVICEQMCDRCLAKESEMMIGCDNMTVVIVGLLHGKTKEQWYSTIAERYKSQPSAAKDAQQQQQKQQQQQSPSEKNYLDDGGVSEDPALAARESGNHPFMANAADGKGHFMFPLSGEGTADEAQADSKSEQRAKEDEGEHSHLSPQERAILHDISDNTPKSDRPT